jgi:hypothetical protein
MMWGWDGKRLIKDLPNAGGQRWKEEEVLKVNLRKCCQKVRNRERERRGLVE